MAERTIADRRVGSATFRVRERRMGFDRRRQDVLPGFFRDNPGWFAAVIVCMVALSAADMVLTFRVLSLGAIEGNPVMAALLASSPVAAVWFKGLVTLLVAACLWLMRGYRGVILTGLLASAVYFVLIAYQLRNLAGMVGLA